MNATELRGVTKTFGRVTALRECSLTLRPGELTALLGPNGAGKTTAISLLLGLAAPTAGQVRVLGHDPRGGAARTRTGSMPQESALPGGLTVRESLALVGSFYPAPLPLSQVLALVGLSELAGRRAGQLSGGQKRRLAFALALVGNPELLLIDEPTTGMDAQSRALFWDAVQQLRDQGRTLLLTTHYLEEAERTADRVVVMTAGRVVADGTPDQLRASVGGARVRLRCDLVLAELQALPLVTQASTDHAGCAELHTQHPEALLAELYARRISFSELEVTRSTLEDAYLQLTA